MKHGSGRKGRDDKSSGIEIRIAEALLAKQAARRNRNCSDSSRNSLARVESIFFFSFETEHFHRGQGKGEQGEQ
jgi:hypothetical protein